MAQPPWVPPQGLVQNQAGKGNHWTSSTRLHLVHVVINMQVEDPDYVIERVFFGQQPSRRWVQTVVRDVKRMSYAELDDYILGPNKRGGNDKKLNHDEITELLHMRRVNNYLRAWQLRNDFSARYQFPLLEGPSRRTVSRITHHAHISCKKATITSLGCCIGCREVVTPRRQGSPSTAMAEQAPAIATRASGMQLPRSYTGSRMRASVKGIVLITNRKSCLLMLLWAISLFAQRP